VFTGWGHSVPRVLPFSPPPRLTNPSRTLRENGPRALNDREIRQHRGPPVGFLSRNRRRALGGNHRGTFVPAPSVELILEAPPFFAGPKEFAPPGPRSGPETSKPSPPRPLHRPEPAVAAVFPPLGGPPPGAFLLRGASPSGLGHLFFSRRRNILGPTSCRHVGGAPRPTVFQRRPLPLRDARKKKEGFRVRAPSRARTAWHEKRQKPINLRQTNWDGKPLYPPPRGPSGL